MKAHSVKRGRVKFIDKTLPEIAASTAKTSSSDMLGLCCLFKALGVDLIEIDGNTLKILESIPSDICFLYRIKERKDIALCLSAKIKSCIVDSSMLNEPSALRQLWGEGISITLEFKADDIKDLDKIYDIKDTHALRLIKGIRVTGLDNFLLTGWCKQLKLVKNLFNIQIEVCPQNRLYCAAALAVEAIMCGVDAVAAAFAGYGNKDCHAALEEIMAASKTLIDDSWEMDLSVLQTLKAQFEKVSGIVIPPEKPVIGRDIFKYESGIHADGINKNPITYEPFNPKTVGLQRTLQIGKHSGRDAISSKLKELGLNSEGVNISELLDKVRCKSIFLRRGLNDDEIVELCGGLL